MDSSAATGSTPLRALLIEDSEFDARVITNLLRGGGYTVTSRRVETAAAMQEALIAQPWDIVFSDHQMPAFDAAQALKVLQDSGLDLPFIIVSGGIGEETAVALMKAGAHDFLMKGHLGRLVPVAERELREARNRAEQRAAETRYRRLWETSPDAILMMDAAGVIAFVNPAAEELLGSPATGLIGRNFEALLEDGERPPLLGGAAGSPAAGPAMRELKARTADGRLVVMEVAFSDVEMQARPWHIAFIRDLTARREAEAALAAAAREFGLAREVQQRLFPQRPPAVPGFDIAGASYAAVETGGDSFDFIPIPDGDLGLVVSDVSGHGMGPALIMPETRAYLRIVAFNRRDAGLVLTRANEVLAEDLEDSGRFVTSLLARLDPGARQLAFANAGHPSGYVLDREGQLRRTLSRGGPPLGVESQTTYAEGPPLDLDEGDLIVLTTDGVAEAESPAGSAFGEARLLEVVRAHRNEPAREIIAAVRTALMTFCGSIPQQDDITLIVVKVLAG